MNTVEMHFGRGHDDDRFHQMRFLQQIGAVVTLESNQTQSNAFGTLATRREERDLLEIE